MEFAAVAAEFEPRIAPIVRAWYRLTAWQKRVATVDALVEQYGGGLTAGEFLGAVARAAFEATGGVSDLCVAAALPTLTQRTIDSAMRLDSEIGQRDRHALLAHAGLLPQPRPVTVRLRQAAPSAPDGEPELSAFLKAPGEGQSDERSVSDSPTP
jgi:hypothetical protein